MIPFGGVVVAGEEVPPIVTAGLVMHLDAGDANSWAGSGTWQDLVGGYDWVRNGPAFNGTVGGWSADEYFSFDDADDYFEQAADWSGSIPRNLGRSDMAATVEVWVWPDGTRAGPVDSLIGNTASPGNKSFQLEYFPNGNLRQGGYDGAGGFPATGAGIALVSDRWNHIVCATHPAATPAGFFLINGNKGNDIGHTQNWSSGDSTYRNRIGASLTGSGWLKGRVAIVRIYGRLLTVNEARRNFQAQRGRFGV